MSDATLMSFARVNDEAAADRSTLHKQAVLAEYLKSLEERDLRLTVRYAGGRPFASSDERVLGVSWAAVTDAALSILRLDPQTYHELVVRSGEIGEALARVWPQTNSAGLRLVDLAEGFEQLSASGSGQAKRSIVRGLLERCRHPREVAYLCKIIFREMRTGVQEGVLQAAVARAFNFKLPEIQRAQLLLGDLEEVALLAKRRELHTAKFRLFRPIQFMLATPRETARVAEQTLAGRSFLAEDKFDGIRAQIHKSGQRVAIYTRTMDRAEESFPEVVESIQRLPGEFLLDGEIVPWCDGCVLPFAHIQRRLGRKALSPRIVKDNPAVFVAFDILYHDGELLLDHPLHQRRQHLEELCRGSQMIVSQTTSVTTAEQIERAFSASRGRRNEGIVLKDPESPYAPGRRGRSWLKIKTHLPTFDCVVTAAEYGHGKRRGVLSDYTFAVWDRDPADPDATLVNIGKAYSGVSDQEIAQLTELFLNLSVKQVGRMHWVRPQVVLEIACDQIQRSERHGSGYALRFPRIKRIRWDKRPEDADRIARLAEVARSELNFARVTREPLQSELSLFD